jgi:hypothetical protein
MMVGLSVDALVVATVVIETGTFAPMMVLRANIITTIQLFGCIPIRTKAEICTTMVSVC